MKKLMMVLFDACYDGESGGQPSYIASPEAYVEDFSAAGEATAVRAWGIP